MEGDQTATEAEFARQMPGGMFVSSMERLAMEFKDSQSENGYSVESDVIWLSEYILNQQDLIDRGRRDERGTNRFSLTPALMSRVDRIIAEMQIFLERAAGLLQRGSCFRMDPGDACLPILRSATELSQLHACWTLLMKRVKISLKFFEKYQKEYSSGEAVNSPSSTNPEIYDALSNIGSPDLQLRYLYSEVPRHSVDLSVEQKATLGGTEPSWDRVWRPPADLTSAFPPRDVEERPLVLSYSTDGTRVLSIEKEGRSATIDDSKVTKRSSASYKGKDKERTVWDPSYDLTGNDSSQTMQDEPSREDPASKSALNITGYSSADPNASVLFHNPGIPFKSGEESIFVEKRDTSVPKSRSLHSPKGEPPEPFKTGANRTPQTYGIFGRVVEPSEVGRMTGEDSFGAFSSAPQARSTIFNFETLPAQDKPSLFGPGGVSKDVGAQAPTTIFSATVTETGPATAIPPPLTTHSTASWAQSRQQLPGTRQTQSGAMPSGSSTGGNTDSAAGHHHSVEGGTALLTAETVEEETALTAETVEEEVAPLTVIRVVHSEAGTARLEVVTVLLEAVDILVRPEEEMGRQAPQAHKDLQVKEDLKASWAQPDRLVLREAILEAEGAATEEAVEVQISPQLPMGPWFRP
ncbi:hypothetical protein DFH06DRAFT_1313222 [Mycena polygramma]|nr:hypothetical protein DFH06DRAFT_1313222 [Mycena polygramma]